MFQSLQRVPDAPLVAVRPLGAGKNGNFQEQMELANTISRS
jgi:hypothetical protein